MSELQKEVSNWIGVGFLALLLLATLVGVIWLIVMILRSLHDK